MPLFRHNDQSLHYLLRGHGEPLLLIHGLGSSGAEWAMQVAALEGQFCVVVPDLPGCGHSGMLPSDCSIAGFARSLWALIDYLAFPLTNIVGFSLGGAVALEMALQRPESVPRLALINSLASYQVDHWRKWLVARMPRLMIAVFGMRALGRLSAGRLFPHAWQREMRERASVIIGAVPARSYLGLMRALEEWTTTDRLNRLKSRTLVIAAEHDYTPVADKQLLALLLGADLLVIRGSRHGTPFDSIKATNASLGAMLSDKPLPPEGCRTCDEFNPALPLTFVGSLAEEHAMGP